jgi:hypothetical protein
MEIRRVANNEGFIKNIILSIDDNMNNFDRNYARFNYYFKQKMSETSDPIKALEFAKVKLAEAVSARRLRNLRKEKMGITTEPSLAQLQREQSAINLERKEQRREEIRSMIKAKSGYEDEEVLKYLYEKFIQSKRSNKLSDESTVDKIIFNYKEKLANEAPPEELQAPEAPPTEEEIAKARRIIEYLDPKNRTLNLETFRKYLQRYNINDAFHFIQDLIKYRQFLKLNGLPVNSTTIRIFETYGQDLEKAKEMVIKWQAEKAMPVESEVLDSSKGVRSKYNDVMVDYNGERVPLHRIIQKLYGGLSLNLKKKSYATVKDKIFVDGFSLDEAIEFNNKELEIIKNRGMFRQQFPEDPVQAEQIFESYYIDEEMPFEQALERTRQEIYGNRSATAQKKYKIRIK